MANGGDSGGGMARWAPVPIVIAIFQTLLLLGQWAVWSRVEDHEGRIRVNEAFVARGDRWTLADQRLYESKVGEALQAIQVDLGKIKDRLGIEERRNK